MVLICPHKLYNESSTIDATNLVDPRLALESYVQQLIAAITFNFGTKDMNVSEYLTIK